MSRGESRWGFQMKAVPLPELLVPTGGPGGAPPASMAAGEDRESFGLGHRRMKWEQSKGAVRLPAAFGVSERGVAPPPQQPGCRNIPGTARRSCSSSRPENKSASCSHRVFKARKVGAMRALPGWAALPAPAARPDLSTRRDRRVPLFLPGCNAACRQRRAGESQGPP